VSARPVLLFVYNADSGLFNTMADIGHKLFAPATYACALCALTHGYFRELPAWRGFIEGLACDCEFLHRDQFAQRHPGEHTALPAVFREGDAGLECCLDAATLKACSDLDALQQLIIERCCRGRRGTVEAAAT